MVPVMSLWLPILLSAVVVFILSSLIHMVLGYHKHDYDDVANEDTVLSGIRGFGLPPGNYLFPCARSMKEMGSPEFKAKHEAGVSAILTVRPAGAGMGMPLLLWFLYSLVVGVFVAYIAGRALEPGEHYLQVFRFAGATAFLAYGLAHWQESIWYGRKLGTSIRNTIDALIYALFTAGIFGWLWPMS